MNLRFALIALAVMVPVAAVVAMVATTLMPVQLTFTARWLCDPPYTDPFIVSDHVGRGGTNFTMYCTSPRGSRQKIGWLDPFLIMWAVYYLTLTPFAGMITYLRTSRY